DEQLRRVLNAAFYAPTNDHLRQFHFVVVRDRQRILQLVAPMKANMPDFTQGVESLRGKMDADEYDMFADALPKQEKMLVESGCLVLPFFRHVGRPLLRPSCLSDLNYFASVWCAIENIFLAVANEGLACTMHIPIADEAEHVKRAVGAPEGYEFPCFIAIGYKSENARMLKQKDICMEERVHHDVW
ncbi:MAG: nitroreductase family protein, partial [Prevotellaceae bacterium]|nr:nitroreductase family protein [Prevotellaceae bacterium]